MAVSVVDFSMSECLSNLELFSNHRNVYSVLDDSYNHLFSTIDGPLYSCTDKLMNIMREAADAPLCFPVRLDMLVDSGPFNPIIKNDIDPQNECETYREEYVKRVYRSPQIHHCNSSQESNSLKDGKNRSDCNEMIFKNSRLLLTSASDITNKSVYHDSLHFSEFNGLENNFFPDFNSMTSTDDEHISSSNFSTPVDNCLYSKNPETPESAPVLIPRPIKSCDLTNLRYSRSSNNIPNQENKYHLNLMSDCTVMPCPASNSKASLSQPRPTVHKSKDTQNDPEACAKREKHNSMEKVRRKEVSLAFSRLAIVLDNGDGKGKKPSKSTLLRIARESVVEHGKRVSDHKAACLDSHSRRLNLLAKLES